MMKLESSSANLRIDRPQPNGQIAGRTPPTDPRVSTYSLARAIEEMGAAMVFPRDAEIYRESSPATYLYKVISGTVRTLKTMSNGRRHIPTFYLSGDIFGVETGPELATKSSFRCRARYRRLPGAHDRDGVAHDDAPRKGGCDCVADIPTGRATQPFRIGSNNRRVCSAFASHSVLMRSS
jgi:hypothetical protein